jgi:hypothetical protein
MRSIPRYPRNYDSAAAILHDQREQQVLMHDDLVLAFVYGAIVVVFRNRPIIHWPRNENVVLVTAADADGVTNAIVISHVKRFLPRGWKVHCNRAGRMLLHSPLGRTSVGNKQRIALIPEPQPLDPM